MKKLMFTVLNYMLPEKGILPLHCLANEGSDDVANFEYGFYIKLIDLRQENEPEIFNAMRMILFIFI